MDLETTPFHTKRTRDPEKLGPRNKSKTRKSYLDPITLIEEELNDIGDMVQDATMELL